MTRKAAVLGSPIAHSLSPKLHGYWLEHYGVEGTYEAIETAPEQLAERLKELQNEGYSGCNLTVPLKEQVLPLLDWIDPAAQAIGAVNTVVFTPDGAKGYNTDAFGFMRNIEADSPGSISRWLKKVVVIGAGGAARAVVAGLLESGAEHMTIVNRSTERAGALVSALKPLTKGAAKLQVAGWDQAETMLRDATMLVNTTSLGMLHQPPLELSLENLPTDALVTDIVYNPLETGLLASARARGNSVVDGLGMLLYQAQPAFEYFYGVTPDVTDELRAQLVE